MHPWLVDTNDIDFCLVIAVLKRLQQPFQDMEVSLPLLVKIASQHQEDEPFCCTLGSLSIRCCNSMPVESAFHKDVTHST